MLECTIPLSDDSALRKSVSDINMFWSSFRLSKFYETCDALTADVAYRHTDGIKQELALVTAGHYQSQFLPTSIKQDLVYLFFTPRRQTTKFPFRSKELRWLHFGNVPWWYPNFDVWVFLRPCWRQTHAWVSTVWIGASVIICMTVILTLVTFVGEAIREAYDPKKYTYYE